MINTDQQEDNINFYTMALLLRSSKATILLILVLIAAKTDPNFQVVGETNNPSGSCVSDNNGGRKGYHGPGPNDTYLPDCSNPLQRELWRVFEQEDGTAYMIPRPDGLGVKYNLCTTDDTSIGAPRLTSITDNTLVGKAEQYGLCDDVSDPSFLNNMDPGDALQFANIFHRQLYFVANGESIDPWVPDTDILAACEILSQDENAAAKTYCEEVANRCSDNGACFDIAIIPSKEAVTQLIPALNEIYGTANQGDDCVPEDWGEPIFGCPVADCVEAPEGCEFSFDHYVINDIHDCCEKQCYAVDSDGNECSMESSSSLPYSSSWFFVVTLLLLTLAR